jgi:oligopeptide transport system substrate-binding protein
VIPFKVLKLLKKRQCRFPKVYEEELLLEVLLQTLAVIDKPLKRTTKELERLVFIQYHLRKKLQIKEKIGDQRNLEVKFFIKHEDGNRLLSIAIGVELLHQHELLQEKHIYRALVCLLPGIKVIPGSFYCCRNRDETFLFCYLEIEKVRGSHLTSKNIDLLRKKLPSELQQSIQSLTPSLLFSYNEEEVYKSAIQLARELKSEDDIPQVHISFQAQTQVMLRFSVVLVRARKKSESPFEQQAHFLPSSAQLILQRVIPLGPLQKRSVKEAIIFSLETDCSLFLRKNWSIDLNQARNFVAKVVEQLFGSFRDYNGGLLSQQYKQIEQIKKNLRGKYENYYPLMQELFQSFSPPSFRALISTHVAKRMFSLFTSFIQEKHSAEEIVMEKKLDGNSMFLFVKTSSAKSVEILLDEIKAFQKNIHSSTGHSCVTFESEYYLCFVDLNNALDFDIVTHLQKALQRENKGQEIKEQKIIRLNFQEGDPLSLNPQIAIDQRCRCLGKALFEGLTRLNFEGAPEPAAAKEIRASPCQTIYTFILRKHYWSNGEEVSAYDFEQTWKRAISSQSNCLRSDLFYVIKNARAAHQGRKSLNEVKIKAVNAKTLVVELEYPAFYFLHLIAHPIFSPIYKGEEEPYHFNGPFLLKEWRRDHFLHLTANPYYWDKKNVQLKDIHLSLYREATVLYKLFEKGELDWFGEPFSTISGYVSLGEERAWHKKRVNQFYWIYLNTQIFPLHSANIRKAFACAINRKQLTSFFKGKPLLFGGLLRDLSGRLVKWDGNIALAQAFFEKGLQELGISREAFPEVELYWSFPGEQNVIPMIKQQLEAALNIRIKITSLEWKRLSNLLDKREFQMTTCYRSSPFFYSKSYLELFREGSNLYNSSQWEHPQYKNLIDQALQSFSVEEREKHLTEAEHILMEEMPVIPLFIPDYLYRLGPRIKRVAIASNGDVDLKWILTKNDHTSKNKELSLLQK